MAKHKKKADPKADTQEIVKLRDFRNTDPEPEESGEDEEEKAASDRLKKAKVPKAVYRTALILLALILGLTLWINRENLTPENIWSWVKLQVMGSSSGDGFPVPVTGSNVYDSNFTSYNGDAVILSDTALTMLSPSGKELLSLRHSLNEPALCAASGKYLLYNGGSTGYLVLSGTETAAAAAAEKEILAGAVAGNGKFALGVQGSDGASELNVYLKNGTLQYNYKFAKDYITAIALNHDATWGAVCTVRSEKGEMISKVTFLDFSQQDAVSSFETRGNLLVGACWNENGTLYAVGDSSLLIGKASDFTFSEQSYGGRQLTAFRLDAGRAFLSISAYEHAGPSTLLVYQGEEDPVKFEAEERIECISVSGGTAGLLIGTQAVFLDYSTGMEQGRTDAGSDAKSIALQNERTAYVLGVSEVRAVSLE